MDFDNLAILFMGTSLLSNFIIRDALKEVLKLNVGRKKKYREIIKEQNLLRRITLSYIKNYAKDYHYLCKILQLVNYVNLAIFLVFLTMLVLITLHLRAIYFAETLIKLKILSIDIPVIGFYFIKTGHNKEHGGVKWKF